MQQPVAAAAQPSSEIEFRPHDSSTSWDLLLKANEDSIRSAPAGEESAADAAHFAANGGRSLSSLLAATTSIEERRFEIERERDANTLASYIASFSLRHFGTD